MSVRRSGCSWKRPTACDSQAQDGSTGLEAVIAQLTFSERAALMAAPLSSNGLQVTLSAEDALLRARTDWLPDLLNSGRLYPHLQPIMTLADGSIYGHESLIRATIDDRELSGGEIVQAARAHGALFTLDLIGRTVALEQAMPKLADDQILVRQLHPHRDL